MSGDRPRSAQPVPYSAAEDDRIIGLFLAGRRDAEIAASTGRSHKAVRDRLTRLRQAGRLRPAR